MYETYTTSGHRIEWVPADSNAAETALENVDGTGVPGTYAVPGDAPIELDRQIAQAVNAEYRRLIAWDLSITLTDGEVSAGGSDIEEVSIELRDSGALVTGEHTVYLEIDGRREPVELLDGQGVYGVDANGKPAGSQIAVQAVACEENYANASLKKIIDVI